MSSKILREIKPGEEFNFKGNHLICVEKKENDLDCGDCYFQMEYKYCPKCIQLDRSDKKNVIFVINKRKQPKVYNTLKYCDVIAKGLKSNEKKNMINIIKKEFNELLRIIDKKNEIIKKKSKRK